MTSLAIVLPVGRGDAEAESLLREALDIQLADLGPDHPEVAYTSRRLAIVLNRTGRPGDASRLFSEALRIQRETLGPDHPEVGDTYALLGSSMASAGDLEQAHDAYQDAVRIQTAALGADHPTTARTTVASAAVLIDLGRPQEARIRLAPAWEALEAQHEPAHLHLQEARVAYVRLYIREGATIRADSVLVEVERLLTPDQRDGRVGRLASALRADLSNGG